MESHYREQADICGRAAASTTLAQVRERYERAQAAWLAMAERAARTARLRAAHGPATVAAPGSLA